MTPTTSKIEKQFKIRGWLFRFHRDKAGWWVTDSGGFKHYLNLAFCRLVAPDGLIAWRVVIGRYQLEIGKIW